MKELFLKIIEVLTSAAGKSSFEDLGLKPIEFIDTYKEQYLYPEDFEAYPLPSLYFAWNILYDKETKSREGLAAIDLYLVYEQLRDTSNIGATQAEALKYFDTIEHLHTLLDGLQTATTGPLTVGDEGTIEESGIENVYKITYTCTFAGRQIKTADKFIFSVPDAELEINGKCLVKTFEDE